MGDDGIMATLRNGLEDFKPYAQNLDAMALAAQMHAELTGPGAIAPLLGQSSVDEVVILGPRQAMVRRSGQSAAPESLSFSSPDALAWAVELLSGTPFGAERPVIEAATRDGHRLHAIHHSLHAEGPVVRIRRGHGQAPRHDLGQLVASGMMSEAASKLLGGAVQAGLRIAIATAPGARAFPLVAALIHAAPQGQRHVVVRPTDAPAQLPAGTVQLQASRPDAMIELVDAAMGMGAQRLVVHEIGGPEASSVLAALDRGLEGAVISLRGNTGSEALHHLAALASLRDGRVERQGARVAGSLDLVVTLARFGDGLCRVTQVAQPFVTAEGSADATDLIAFDPHARNWTHTGALGGFASTLAARGIHLDLG